MEVQGQQRRVLGRRLAESLGEGERETLSALKRPLRIVINDPGFPISMFLKDETGEVRQSKVASRELYRVSQQISREIKFLPIQGVKLRVEYFDKNKLKDYAMLMDCVIRVLYRACIVDCTSSNSIEEVSIKHIRADRRKVVVYITPTEVDVPEISTEAGTEPASLDLGHPSTPQ